MDKLRSSGPTPEDFARLGEHADFLRENQEAIDAYRTQFQTELPESQVHLFTGLAPSHESLGFAQEAIDADPNLDPVQRTALSDVLFEKWRQGVIAQSGEGFND